MAFLPRDTFKIDVIDGGLNTKNSDLTCPSNMSPSLAHVDFDDLGSMIMSKGSSTFCSALGSARVDGLHSIYFGGTEYLIAAQSACVYHAAASATTFTPVSGSTGVFTAAVDVCARTVLDEVYMTNGYATPHRYDGTNFHTIGVSAYTGGLTAVVASTASAGSITGGAYYYGISGQNINGVESNVATFTTLITVATGAGVTITGIPDCFPASAGVTTRYLYRTTAGSQTEFYRVTALTAAQTSVVDVVADSALVTPAQTDNFPPTACKFFWYYKGRMFAAGDPNNPYRLYYSEAGRPEIWPALNAVEIGEGDGEEITGLASLGNAITVHKTSHNGVNMSIWLVYQPDSTSVSDATNWYIVKSPSAYSAASNKSIVFYENLMGFINKTGMYAFTGDDIARGPATSHIGQYAADAMSENIDSEFSQMTDFPAIPAINYDNKIHLGAYAGTSKMFYSYDYSTASNQRGIGAWSRHFVPQRINNLVAFNGTIYAGGYATGVVYSFFDTYAIDGNDSLSYYFSPRFGGNKQHWQQTKIWRNLYLTMSNSSGSESIIGFFDDNNTYGTQINLVTGTTRSYSTVKIPILDSTGNPMVSRTLQVYLSSYGKSTFSVATGASNPWQIHRMELEYLLRSRRT